MGSKNSVFRALLLSSMAFILVIPFTFSYLLDPIVNVLEKIGIFQTITNHALIWDAILISILFIMIFRAILAEKFGAGVGGVLGLLFAMAFIAAEYRYEFSILKMLGPFAMGIAFFMVATGIYLLLKTVFDASVGIAGCATYSIAYPFVMSAFPKLPGYLETSEYWGILYGIATILWLIALVFLLINGWALIRGTPGPEGSWPNLFSPLVGGGHGGGDHGGGHGGGDHGGGDHGGGHAPGATPSREELNLIREIDRAARDIKGHSEDAARSLHTAAANIHDITIVNRNMINFDNSCSLVNDQLNRILPIVNGYTGTIVNNDDFQRALQELVVVQQNYLNILNRAVTSGLYPWP